MQFEKKVVFLGYKSMTLSRDNAVMHTVSFFDSEAQDTVHVNVMDSNGPVSSVLPSLSFGSPCAASFALRPADRLYRLSLVGLSPVKS